jgi:hypothetical protein
MIPGASTRLGEASPSSHGPDDADGLSGELEGEPAASRSE